MKTSRVLFKAVLVSLLVVGINRISSAADEYEVGGPLQGVKLPLLPTQHGEKLGYPGCIPSLQKPEKKAPTAPAPEKEPAGEAPAATEEQPGEASPKPAETVFVPFTTEGLPPERQLYDGSVEHFRAYWFKYLPVKSSFDRQSLLKNWLAKDIPGVSKNQIQDYAEPVYWVPRHREEQPTGVFNKPVSVVRCTPKGPVFTLDLGVLKPGMYCVRAVGAVEIKELERHRKPVYLRLTVNDGLKGEVTTYRLRCPYVDEFYRVAEFYFNAPQERSYSATLTVDDGSLADLLVYNIDLHDALAGTDFRAIKTKALTPATNALPVVQNDAERLARDEMLWNAFPPINAHTATWLGGGGDDSKANWPNFGCNGLTAEQIESSNGKWIRPRPFETVHTAKKFDDVLLTNTTLKLTYTVADLRAGHPLPEPYPYKDTGCGIYTPAAKAGETPQNWYPVAQGVQAKIQGYVQAITLNTGLLRDKSDAVAGRDAALMLCRAAYQYPSITTDSALRSIVIQPGAYGRDSGSRRRDPRQFLIDVGILWDYDRLFDVIRTDKGLAESVGRFVPWVKQPSDVIKLIDTYLVQQMAKRCMRYQMYNGNEPARILTPVEVLGDNAVTGPWMKWLFSSTFVYPLPPSGLQDVMITGNDRDGIGNIGSYMYIGSEQAAPKAAALEDYILHGGDPKYDLRDQKRYPKPVAACYFWFDSKLAGLYFPRVGDVTGPDKGYGSFFEGNSPQWRYGWRWTHDPKFAYVIKNFGKRGKETDAEWAAVETAAAKITRAPWLDLPSRVAINWFGLLETGTQFDDPRFRRNVYLRVGQGYGHAHDDTLDLEGHAHGYPFTIDDGQRAGYTAGQSSSTKIHNVVLVDDANWRGHSWIETLSDTAGARYLAAQAVPPRNHPNVTLYRRQVALVDVDEGKETTTTPNSYVVDVVRMAGGQKHTYSFHGPVNDEFTANVDNKTPSDLGKRAGFPTSEQGLTGTAPDELVATWRMNREPMGKVKVSEQSMAPAWFDANSPRKYTRLHLLGQKGAPVSTLWTFCKQWEYGFMNLYTTHESKGNSSVVFPAIIEPYVGEPFITGTKLLPVAGNDTDAGQAVAIEIKTKNGHTDQVFSDGVAGKTRKVGDATVAGEFGYISTDAQGLRQATLTGGTLLQTPAVTLKVAARERTGKVIQVDYDEKRMVVDQAWPGAALLKRSNFEVGTPGRMTTYTIDTATPEGKTTRLAVTGGAVFYLSRVKSVDAAKKQVQCALAMPHLPVEDQRPCPGEDKHWVASNEQRTKFWRADYIGPDSETGNFIFQLDGAVTETDFGNAGGLSLFEYGVGDTVRQSTSANLRRVSPAVYELTADADVEVTVNGKTRTVTTEELAKAGGMVTLKP